MHQVHSDPPIAESHTKRNDRGQSKGESAREQEKEKGQETNRGR